MGGSRASDLSCLMYFRRTRAMKNHYTVALGSQDRQALGATREHKRVRRKTQEVFSPTHMVDQINDWPGVGA